MATTMAKTAEAGRAIKASVDVIAAAVTHPKPMNTIGMIVARPKAARGNSRTPQPDRS